MSESAPLQAWLRRLEALHPVEIELGLGRVATVAGRMGLIAHAASPAITVITVAGTNGKGSCVASLECFALAQGLAVGAFTSPHLVHYCERIRVNGQLATDAEVCAAFAAIDAARGDISLTYFEFGTLAALEIFRRRDLRVWVLEVGLGGRLDAVNILAADVAVVTSIAIDHEAWLGNDRDSIGREKAGIFRAGRPAICADPAPPSTLAQVAAEVGALHLETGREWGWQVTGANTWDWWGLTAAGAPVRQQALPWPPLPLPSVAAALQVAAWLGWSCDFAGLIPGLRLSGRAQQLTVRGRTLMLDVAHNPAAAVLLAERLQRQPAPRTFAVLAVMADKDIAGIIAPLSARVAGWYAAGLPGNSRAAAPAQLLQRLREQGASAVACATVHDALLAALAEAGPDDLILVLGSFFTVAAAMNSLQAL